MALCLYIWFLLSQVIDISHQPRLSTIALRMGYISQIMRATERTIAAGDGVIRWIP